MPVPQQAAPLPDGSGYMTRTAFKPGETEMVISYEVGYGTDGYRIDNRVFYDLPEYYVFVAPTDVTIEAEGWEHLGPEPEGRFVALRRRDVTPETPLQMKLSGGSATSASSEAESKSAPSPDANAQVAIIPDRTQYSKAVVVTLMAAALAFGLLRTLYPPPARRG